MREQALLLMAESFVDDPLWFRGSHDPIGQADAEELGLSAGLRAQLEEWNAASDLRGGGDALRADFPVRSFELAAAVQRELGASYVVWCLAGEGDGGLRDHWRTAQDRFLGTRHLLLRGAGTGRRPGLVEWTAREEWIVHPAEWGIERTTMRALNGWLSEADRVVAPGSDPADGIDPAEHRARGAEVAAAVQRDLGSRGSVLWFGGEDVPA